MSMDGRAAMAMAQATPAALGPDSAVVIHAGRGSYTPESPIRPMGALNHPYVSRCALM